MVLNIHFHFLHDGWFLTLEVCLQKQQLKATAFLYKAPILLNFALERLAQFLSWTLLQKIQSEILFRILKNDCKLRILVLLN